MTTTNRHEALGPAERIINTVLQHHDHVYHGRPGVVTPDVRAPGGVRWQQATYIDENGEKIVYRVVKNGRKTQRERLGSLDANRRVINNGTVVGEYRRPGLFAEVAAWLYQQVAEVWKIDNEFGAHWASYCFGQDHRDLATIMTAFALVQNRCGLPVIENGKRVFDDDDFRAVGEAAILLDERTSKRAFNARQILRIYDLLALPAIAAINRELGFGRSMRRPFFGRWHRAVEVWLRYREENPRMLTGLVKAGFRTTVIKLAQRVGYKPTSPRFFEILRWKQVQAQDGRRSIAIGAAVPSAESWAGLTEEQICEAIVKSGTSWKRIVSLVPPAVGVTRAIAAAAIEAGSLSNKELIIASPTIESLGLLEVPPIKTRWEAALKSADDLRAANIARNVRSKNAKEQLVAAADTALQKGVEAETRSLRIYVFIDTSGSMTTSIPRSIQVLTRMLQGFPLDRLHVLTFTTVGRVINIKHPSAAGVANALAGIAANGGTSHGSGVVAARGLQPKDDEDALFIFIGDEGEFGSFAPIVRSSGLRPMAFGVIKLPGDPGDAITRTAHDLMIPCFSINDQVFDDPYAIPRTLRALVGSTPVSKEAPRSTRVTLIDQILATPLLQKPTWA